MFKIPSALTALSKEQKIVTYFLLFSLLLYGVLFFTSSYVTKPVAEVKKSIIVPTKDTPLYDMKGEATQEKTRSTLNYSLKFPSTLIREVKNEGESVLFYYDGAVVAKLTFVYEGKNGLSKEKYVRDVLGQRLPLAIESGLTTFGKYDYMTAAAENSYFRVSSFKKGEWLGALEILPENQEVEKIILGSLEIK